MELFRLFPEKHLAIHDYSIILTDALNIVESASRCFLQIDSVWQVR